MNKQAAEKLGRVHELKCWPEFFVGVMEGWKTFELRKDDRAFRTGDFLLLQEWDPGAQAYTGRDTLVRVLYLIAGPSFGVEAGWVCMSIIRMGTEGEVE